MILIGGVGSALAGSCCDSELARTGSESAAIVIVAAAAGGLAARTTENWSISVFMMYEKVGRCVRSCSQHCIIRRCISANILAGYRSIGQAAVLQSRQDTGHPPTTHSSADMQKSGARRRCSHLCQERHILRGRVLGYSRSVLLVTNHVEYLDTDKVLMPEETQYSVGIEELGVLNGRCPPQTLQTILAAYARY